MFIVVVFDDEGAFDGIPEAWAIKNASKEVIQCYWPPWAKTSARWKKMEQYVPDPEWSVKGC